MLKLVIIHHLWLKKDVSAVSQISNGDFLVKNTGVKARIFYE